MMEFTPVNEPVLQVGPTPEAGGLRRAVCQDCGAHAAVVAAGTSITGTCSVCGSARLLVLDEHLPPPRRWTG